MTDNALMIRPVTFTNAMLTSSNAVEAYDDVEYHVLFSPEAQRFYTIYNYGDIVRDPVNLRLFQSIVPDYALASCTMTNANPIVVTATAHGLNNGDIITFTGPRAGDTLAEDVDVGRPCWVRSVTTNTFQFAYDAIEDSSSVGVILGDPGSGVAFFRKGDTNSSFWNPTVPPGDAGYDQSLADLIAELPASAAATPRWLDLGPDNTRSMFDGYNGTATTWAGDGNVVIEPGTRCDAMGLESVIGASARVVVNNGSGDVYDETYPLIENSEVVDWYTFFYGERRQLTSLLIDDLPQNVLAPEITVTVAAAGGVSQVGTLQFGRQFELGSVELGMTVGIRDFSTKEEDEFGEYTVVNRPWTKKAEARALLENTRVDSVQSVLAAYRSTPVFWRLAPNYSAAILFGFYREFNIEIPYPNHSLVSYEIEAVT